MRCKRLLSLALAVCMLFGSAAMLPRNAFIKSASFEACAVGETWDHQFGKWYTGNIQGGYYNVCDYYYEAKSNGYVQLEAKTEGGGSGHWKLLLLNDYENQFLRFDLGASVKGHAQSVKLGIKKGQKLIVRVGNIENGINVPTNDLQLRLNFVKSSAWESEFNDIFDTADTISPGKTINGVNHNSNDIDYYKFNAPVSGKYTLSFGRPEYSTGDGWNVKTYNNYCENTSTTHITTGSTRKLEYQLQLNKGVNYISVKNSLSYKTTNTQYSLKLIGGFEQNTVKATLNKTVFKFTGSAIKPDATVTFNGKTLKAGTDYTIAYKNNVNPGTATALIEGKGCYFGTIKKSFQITPRTIDDIKIIRLAGDNRYATAGIISKKMYPKTSGTVIIATGLTFHDAMVAVPLASAHNAPLLLATEKHITAQTEAELKRLKAKNVIVVSTNGAIGSGAKSELKALGLKTTYIEGKNVFETSTKVAKALQTQNKKAPDTIFFATDGAFADALSASPVAAVKGAPIIYLNNKSIDKTVAEYLKSVKGKVKNAYIIGGSGVISDAMMKNVANALGLTVNKTVQRVAGKNRYETCVAVNKKFKSVLNSDGICVAKGLDFPDALAGGVYAASTKQALFLADGKELLDAQNSYLKGKNAGKITVFGGTGAVPDELVKLIAQASL